MSGVVTAVATVAVGAYSVYSSEKQAKAQASAQQQAQQQALQQQQQQATQAQQQASQAQQAMNAQNQKQPNSGAILSRAQQAGRGGQSGTMLTGPQGVDPSSLTLGKNTLLGQ